MKGMPPLVFVRTGWLAWYDDRRDDGPPQRGGRYNENEIGSEMNNFRPIGGRCLGYAQTGPLGGGFNLPRLGGLRGADQVDGVTVVQVATQEGGGQVVVGWFTDATCLAETSNRPRSIAGGYNYSARAAGCVLLPIKDRTMPALKGAGGFGQANVCYADPAAPWVRPILKAIKTGRWPAVASPSSATTDSQPGRPPSPGGQGRMSDALKRVAIEQHAVTRAIAYFEHEGYEVRDVGTTESWDLLCTRSQRGARETLQVEVKGTQSNDADVALLFTSNEIDLANNDARATALFVVRGIQAQQSRGGAWITSGGDETYVKSWRPVADRLAATQYRYRFNVRERK